MPPMIIDFILFAGVGLTFILFCTAWFFSSAVNWPRDVTVTGLSLALAVLLALWWRWPRQAISATRRLRGIIGPAALIAGTFLGLTAISSTLAPDHGQPPLPFFAAIYKAFQFFPLNAEPDALRGQARWVSNLVLSAAVLLFLCVAIEGIALLFHDSLSAMRLALANRHIVICGIGRIGHQLVDDLVGSPLRDGPAAAQDGRTVVVIESAPDHPDLLWLREHGVIVITGQAQREEVLRKARVTQADEVFVVTGSDEINVECVVELRDQLRRSRRRAPLRCHVHLRDRDLASSMRERLQATGCETSPQQPKIDIEVFNTTERTVRRLFESLARRSSHLLPMQPDEVAHVVIIGFGEFGQNLALSLAELAHFPNCRRLRMTIVDPEIEAKERSFRARYPRFTHKRGSDSPPHWSTGPSGGIEYVCNASFEQLVDIGEQEWVQQLDSELMKADVKPLVFVCFDQERVNFKLAERLKRVRDRIGDRYDGRGIERPDARIGAQRWPIHVWIPSQRELSQLLEGHDDSLPDPIPFGRCFGAVSYSEVTHSWANQLAMLLRYGYVGFNGAGDIGERWKDFCAVVPGLPCKQTPPAAPRYSWEDHLAFAREHWRTSSTESFRASDRSAAIHAVIKLAALGLAITERAPDSSSSSEARKHAWGLLAHARQKEGVQIDNACSVSADAVEPIADGNLETIPTMEHYRWCAERLIAGWTYTQEPPETAPPAVSDDLKKRQSKHWCLVPYDDLPKAVSKPDSVAAGSPPAAGAQGKDLRQLDCIPLHIVLALAAHGRLFDMVKISTRPLTTTNPRP